VELTGGVDLRRRWLQIFRTRWQIPRARWTNGDAVSWGRWRRGLPWLVLCGEGGNEGGARDGFPAQAERRDKEGKAGAGLGAPRGEEEEVGGGSGGAGKAVGVGR
jgi:hypothetical protein